MYKALLSFTTIKPYQDVQKGEILESDFDTPEEIEKYLSIGYIEEYDESLNITKNGTYDVTNYEQVDVNVGGGKYAPKWISFANYGGTDLDYETANLDTSNLTTMQNLFNSCTNLTSIDISSWNTSNVTSMYNMFNVCSKITSINFGNIDLSNVNTMVAIFYNCGKLTTIKMPTTVFNQDLNFTNAFGYDREINEIDISGVSLGNNATINMSNSFQQCNALTKLDMRGIDTSKISNYSGMLNNVPTNCLIIVGTDADKTWFATNFPTYTNVKTVAEYEG